MGVSSSITRIADYYSRHGFSATIRRAGLQARRTLFSSRTVVFYCDLGMQTSPPANIPSSLKLERLQTYAELSAADLQEMISFWSPKQALRDIEERMDRGATLWLTKSGDRLAGYGWTIQGRPIAPYYFPMGPDDVQLFDFYVFPKFRGRAMHCLLTAYILQTLAAEGGSRAFADTGEWNQAQLASFKMTPFRRLGFARSITILGRKFTSWSEDQFVSETQNDLGVEHKSITVARSRER